MQTDKQMSNAADHQTQSINLHKIFYTLSAMLLAFTLHPTSPSLASNFGGQLKGVTITDSAGTNTPPTAMINFSKEGDTINFDASSSSDPDGSLVSYLWDFGDGTTGTGVTVTHQFATETPYITLNVIDDQGGVALTQVSIGSPKTYAYSDDFSIDTTGNYTVTNTMTAGGIGQFLYKAQDQRARLLTGNDVGLRFSHSLPSSGTGVSSIDFLPTTKYPSGGKFFLMLVQDENNYYKIFNTDGYGPGGILKFVAGVEVDRANFKNEYSQNNNYHITATFSPDKTTVEAFGEVIVINKDSSLISVSNFEVITYQQDAYYDNIIYIDSK